MKYIAKYIIKHYSQKHSEWFDDCLNKALEKLTKSNELSVLERINKRFRRKVRNHIRAYVRYCEERKVPPRIRLVGSEIRGKQRPKVMDDLQHVIRSLEPFEFQRLCCVYIEEAMGYHVVSVNRQDKGADIVAKKDFPIVAQARLHRRKDVGKTEIQQWVRQVKENYSGAAFVFMTGNLYSKQARKYAEPVGEVVQPAGKAFVRLIDGEQIAFFLFQKNISPPEIRDWLDRICQACRIPKCDLRPT